MGECRFESKLTEHQILRCYVCIIHNLRALFTQSTLQFTQLCEQAHEMQIQRRLRRRLIVEGGTVETEQFTLAAYTHNRLFNVDLTSSHESKRATFSFSYSSSSLSRPIC